MLPDLYRKYTDSTRPSLRSATLLINEEGKAATPLNDNLSQMITKDLPEGNVIKLTQPNVGRRHGKLLYDCHWQSYIFWIRCAEHHPRRAVTIIERQKICKNFGLLQNIKRSVELVPGGGNASALQWRMKFEHPTGNMTQKGAPRRVLLMKALSISDRSRCGSSCRPRRSRRSCRP